MSNYIRSYSDKHSVNHWQILIPTATSIFFSFFGVLAVIWYGGRAVHNGLDFWFLNLFTGALPLEQLANIEDSLFNASLFFQNTSLNGALLFLFWVFVGVFVYEIIQGTVYFFFEIQEESHFITYQKPGEQHHAPSLVIATILRTLLRFIFTIVFVAYAFICFKIIWPSLLAVLIRSISEQLSIVNLVLLLGTFTSLFISFHGLVVAMRLMAMRTRIFGKQL